MFIVLLFLSASHQAKSFSKLSRASTLYHSVSSMARVDYRLRRVSIRNTQQLNGISLAMTTSSSLPIFDVYPFISHTDFPTRQSKIVHFCRHAQAYHNINHTYRNIQNLDARLTTAGMVQCQSLAGRISKAEVNREPYLHHLRENVELIVTSPLTRCIQTTLHSFEPVLNRKGGKPPPPVLAHDLIRETVNYICDRRRTRSEIQRDFTCPTTQRPLVDLSHVATEHDDIWERYEKRLGNDESYTMHRESAELHVVADRARDFLTWLAQRPEKHVLVCSHAAFLRCLWNYGTPSYDLAQFPKQMIDERPNPNEFIPVIRYQGDAMLPAYMGKDFENCELRTVVVAFRDSSDT